MILLGDAALVLKIFVDSCISLTVTSPPYDDMRTYGGHSFDFEEIAGQLYRVTEDGGIVVWIVGDATNEGSESLTSFKQANRFKEIGFRIHDTMIYEKANFAKPSFNRYHQIFEYMFILSKGRPKTFNPILDKRNVCARQAHYGGGYREVNGQMSRRTRKRTNKLLAMRSNIWRYKTAFGVGTNDKIAYNHPAIMQDKLAQDHIKSWSNEGDLILDPFAGSGTTLKAAQQLNRRWVGIEINQDYVQLAKKRLTPYVQQSRLTSFPLENISY